MLRAATGGSQHRGDDEGVEDHGHDKVRLLLQQAGNDDGARNDGEGEAGKDGKHAQLEFCAEQGRVHDVAHKEEGEAKHKELVKDEGSVTQHGEEERSKHEPGSFRGHLHAGLVCQHSEHEQHNAAALEHGPCVAILREQRRLGAKQVPVHNSRDDGQCSLHTHASRWHRFLCFLLVLVVVVFGEQASKQASKDSLKK